MFDLVRAAAAHKAVAPVQGVLRSGCYVTHDNGTYARFLKQVETARASWTRRCSAALGGLGDRCSRCPEPGLALPRPAAGATSPTTSRCRSRCAMRRARARRGRCARRAGRSARSTTSTPTCASMPRARLPQVGDRVGAGHLAPCTTFDKWRWLVLVEDDLAVSGAISTRF